MLMERSEVEDMKYLVIEGIDMATFKPMPHHLVVRWLKKVESKGGILYPENRQRKNYMKGEILKVGEDCDMDLKAGAIIQFDALCDKQFLGVQDPADRDTVFIMRDEDLHGVLIRPFTNNEPRTVFEPLNDYVLIKPEDGKPEVSGVIVPKSVDKKKTEQAWAGDVIAIGPEAKKQFGNDILPGQRVAYDAFTAHEVMMNDEKHIVIRAAYIMGEVDPSHDLGLVGAV